MRRIGSLQGQAATAAAKLHARQHPLSAIGNELEAVGCHPPRNRKWHPATIAKRIARREAHREPSMQNGSHPW